MRKRKRCNLCGAKLSGDICRECGYNNAAYDYSPNTPRDTCTHSSADQFFDNEDHWKHMDPEPGEAFKEQKSSDKTKNAGEKAPGEELPEGLDWYKDRRVEAVPNKHTVTYGLNKERTKKKKKGKKRWLWIIPVLWLLPSLIEMGADFLSDLADQGITLPFQNEQDETETEAAEGLVVLEDGDQFTARLSRGVYVAGIHIPEGVYELEAVSGTGTFEVWNREDGYGESGFLSADGNSGERGKSDLELSAGTMLLIRQNLRVRLAAEQNLGYLEKEKNPLQKTILLKDGMMVGEDIPAGTYRVVGTFDKDYAGLLYRYATPYGESYTAIDFARDSVSFENIILQEGDVLVKINCEVILEPADYDLSEYAGMIFY